MDWRTRCVITGNVFRTSDYSIFKRLEGNRPVLARRVSKIASSISKNGYVFNPIVVNEAMQIIDGQGRFEALKQAGLPIDFVVSEGAGLDECVALNMYATPWTLRDYIDSYHEMGNQSYLLLKFLLDQYKDLPLNVVLQFVSGTPAIPNEKIKSGTLALTDDMVETAKENLNFVKLVQKNVESVRGGSRYLYYAIGFARMCGADEVRLLSCIQRSVLQPAPNIRYALDEISDLYNWNLKDPSRRMYFYPKYEETLSKKYGWYSSKWGTNRTQA